MLSTAASSYEVPVATMRRDLDSGHGGGGTAAVYSGGSAVLDTKNIYDSVDEGFNDSFETTLRPGDVCIPSYTLTFTNSVLCNFLYHVSTVTKGARWPLIS